MADTRRFLERTLLSNPWTDHALPSLVYFQDGKIIGFIGSNVRRMLFDDRPIRVVSTAHLMIDPTTHTSAAGALLLARLLRGRQELSTTDTASTPVRAMWHRLGGETVQLGSVSWVRVFRPSAVARSVFGSRRWLLSPPARPAWVLADLVLRRVIRSLYPSAHSGVSAEPLTPALAVEHLPKVAAPFRVRPAYEESYLEWLFGELERFGEGTPVRRLIRSGGRVMGSYVYLLQRDAISRVLQVAAKEEDAEAVLGDLFEHARTHGAAALRGRVEPHLQEALRRSGVFLFPAATHALIHSRHPQLLHVVQSGNALITLLDGEWWSGMQSPTWPHAAAPDSLSRTPC